jgi:hypothetical protein
MEKEQNWEKLLEWAISNDKNRQEAIITASMFILTLSATSSKNLSEDELKRIFAGGSLSGAFWKEYKKVTGLDHWIK